MTNDLGDSASKTASAASPLIKGRGPHLYGAANQTFPLEKGKKSLRFTVGQKCGVAENERKAAREWGRAAEKHSEQLGELAWGRGKQPHVAEKK